MALRVPAGVTERGAVEEVLRRHALAAVDARVELAAAEHRVAVRLHGKIAGLDLKHRLSQADIGAHDYGEVAIILLVDDVADVRCGHLELISAGLDLHG